MSMSMNKVIMITVSLVVMAILLPIGIGYISDIGNVNVTINGTTSALSTLADSSVITLLSTVIPIVVAVAILLAYLPKAKGG